MRTAVKNIILGVFCCLLSQTGLPNNDDKPLWTIGIAKITAPGFWSGHVLENNYISRLKSLNGRLPVDIRVGFLSQQSSVPPVDLSITGQQLGDNLMLDFVHRFSHVHVEINDMDRLLEPDQLIDLKEQTAVNPLVFLSLYALARDLIYREHHRAAKGVLQAALRIMQNKIALDDNLAMVMADALVDSAQLNGDAQSNAETEQMLKQALALNPKHGTAHYLLANTYNVQDKKEQSGFHYRQVLEAYEVDISTHMDLGNINYTEHDYHEAKRHLHYALALSERSYRAQDWLLGRLATKSSGEDRKYLQIKRKVLLRKRSFVHSGLGKVYYHEKNYAKATRHFKAALKLNKNDKNAEAYLSRIKDQTASR